MLNSILREWFLGSVSCRRRANAFGLSPQYNTAAELLEVRVLPACLAPGRYKDPFEVPATADILDVFPSDKKKVTGNYEYSPEDGGNGFRFTIKVLCKKGHTTLASKIKSVKFSASVEETEQGIRVTGTLQIQKDGPLISINDEMTHNPF